MKKYEKCSEWRGGVVSKVSWGPLGGILGAQVAPKKPPRAFLHHPAPPCTAFEYLFMTNHSSLSLFSLLSSLFSLLSSLFSLLSLLSSLFTRCCCCWLQDAVAVAELFAARSLLSILCALPSSLLGADPFLYHPALLEPHRCLLRPRGTCHFEL